MEPIFISIVIPAYNEAKRIWGTLSSLDQYLASKDFTYEIIVVNDGSTDATAEIVTGFQRRINHLRLVDYYHNRGKGYAVRRGMEEAAGTYRLFMDADNSVRIETVEPFLTAMHDGANVVIGSIAIGESAVVDHNDWYRRSLGSISKWLIRTFATPGIYDTQRGFKLFTAAAADSIFRLQTIERFGFDIELLVIAHTLGFKIKELPVEWNNPAGSTVHLADYGRTLLELGVIVFNKMRGKYTSPDPAVLKLSAE